MALTLISCHKTQSSVSTQKRKHKWVAAGQQEQEAGDGEVKKNEITSRQCNKFKLIEFQSKHNLSHNNQTGSRQQPTVDNRQATVNTCSMLHSTQLNSTRPYNKSHRGRRQSVRRGRGRSRCRQRVAEAFKLNLA